jgi:predicted phage terminase large subunit-like protein
MSDTADYMDDSFVEIEVEGNPNFDDGIDVFFNEENEGTLGFDPDEEPDIEFDDNIAEYLDRAELGLIASKLTSAYEDDLESRKDWYETFKDGLELLGIKSDPRSEPFQGASGVYHPLLAEAVTQFQALAYKELLPAGGPVDTKVMGKLSDPKLMQANRVKNFMNYQIMYKMEEYDPEMDQLLFYLPLSGSAFKKSYYDPTIGRAVSRFVKSEDLVVPYYTTDLITTPRITHVIHMTENIGGALAGRGADLFIIDDPHSEQDAFSDKALEEAYEWYQTGPRQRLQPGGAIVIVMTRWSKKDVTGKLIKKMTQEKTGDKWELIEFPAILPSGKPLWPEFWSLEELEATKSSIPPSKWAAQYMQRPTGEGISIIPKEWFKIWPKDNPPSCDYLIQSYDTAFLKSERADYTAITTWGVFYPEGKIGEDIYSGNEAHIVLLDCVKERFDFPELKQEALRLYEYWNPDTMIIETKASGIPLTQELRRLGIPINTYSPNRGQDKIARLNSVSPIFQDGKVWVPENRWAEDLVDEVSDFPNGDNDDLVDATTLALMRFRTGGFLQLKSDFSEEEEYYPKLRVYY